ncbi:MAG: acyl-CoA dehydrogenase family protein [Rhodospirillaceae bacterium]
MPNTQSSPALLPDLISLCQEACPAIDQFVARAKSKVAPAISADKKIDPAAMEKNQFAAHGFAWFATYAQGLRQILHWAEQCAANNQLGPLEQLILQISFGEYTSQLLGGIPISASEIVRPHDLGLDDEDTAAFLTPPVRTLIEQANSAAARQALSDLIVQTHHGSFGEHGIHDEALLLARQQFSRFVDEQVIPPAQSWHLNNDLIPREIIQRMADLGVFGLTLPEDDGGLGLGKIAMAMITEELSRGSLAVGSLSTRSEIAAELIRAHGTQQQQQKYLAKIAAGEILPTAVFTEPDVGSDIASIKTRAIRNGDAYAITGNKTWITHGARADLMTLLVRTGSPKDGYKGLSMFLAEKPPGTEQDPFPANGMSGQEIEVLGYRGMKEFEIAFDGFTVPVDALLGGEEGQGFKQLMATFETARIQTAARSVGVAQSALELAFQYAEDRKQFSKPLTAYPRIAGKLAFMAAETMMARQLTYFAAREKDSGKRCDIEAGMAKLLAARIAWTNADSAVQIFGGMGYALETPISRVLCDARILNIFEGTAEIQAQIIARGLIGNRN